MLYYFVTDKMMFEEIKMAYQFVEAISTLGVPAVIASPGGRAADGFFSHAAVADAEGVRDDLRPEDIVVFSLPEDYTALSKLPGQLVFHCHGIDAVSEPILANPAVQVLTCGKQTTEYAHACGVSNPIEIGVSVASCFFYTGERKFENAVACTQACCQELCEALVHLNDHMRFIATDPVRENERARVMKYSSIYLAASEHAMSGLSALEAMAAGCLVVSVPVWDAMDYLDDGVNCRIVKPRDFVNAVGELLQEQNIVFRFRMRQAAIATARRYTTGWMIKRLSSLLEAPLSNWRKTG